MLVKQTLIETFKLHAMTYGYHRATQLVYSQVRPKVNNPTAAETDTLNEVFTDVAGQLGEDFPITVLELEQHYVQAEAAAQAANLYKATYNSFGGIPGNVGSFIPDPRPQIHDPTEEYVDAIDITNRMQNLVRGVQVKFGARILSETEMTEFMVGLAAQAVSNVYHPGHPHKELIFDGKYD